MNKSQLIDTISEKIKIEKKNVSSVIETLLETITNTLKSGGEISLTGFGVFKAKKRAERMGVNPQKPEQKIKIPAVTVPKFKAGKSLKDALK